MSSRSEIRLNRHGFTLIEVMVATLILTVGLLGMFQAINIAMDQGVENQLRQKGVEVSEQHMSDLKARPFSNITGTTRLSVRTAIGSVFKNMSVESRAVDLAALNSQTKQISVRVWWRHRGRLYEHQTASGIGITDGSTGQ
jgi:type IV pilus assembly protein PilV